MGDNIVWGTIVWLILKGVSAAMVFGTVIWGTKAGQIGAPPPRTVPDLMGMTQAEADRALTHADLNGTFTGTGHVSAQSPAAGTSMFYGDTVNVTLT
jgi:hypothetical protein